MAEQTSNKQANKARLRLLRSLDERIQLGMPILPITSNRD
jgi:hypothetical protein